MRFAAVVVTLVVGGLFAGIAAADIGVPVPSPPPVTVPTLPSPPPLPVPLPPTPTPSPPSAPAPAPSVPSVPSTPVTAPSVGSVTGAVSSVGSSASGRGATGASGGSSGSGSSGSGSSASGGGSGSDPGAASGNGDGNARVSALHASRTWLAATGPKSHRKTKLVYRLAKAGRVVFTIRQVSPRCVVVGSFVAHGHAGTNRTTFGGRVHGHQLPPGTYQITARTPHGAKVLRLILVVVDSGVPTPAELAAARAQNVCAVQAALASNFSFGGLSPAGSQSGASGSGPQASEIVRNQQQEAAGGDDHGVPGLGGLSPRDVSKAVSNPLVIASLAAAIALLGLAALPRRAVPDPRLDDLLARHRGEVALAGVGALLAAITAMLLS